jgi:hypothetical protein
MQRYVSIREYARQKGVSDTAVHKAIAAGHILDDALQIVDGKKKGIDPSLADFQWSQSISVAKSRKPDPESRFTAPKPAPKPAPVRDIPADTSLAPTANGAPSTAKAQQVEAVFKAKLRELEFKKKSGSVVDKAQVYRALFAAGQEIRTAFQSIPDRTIDDILAAPSRNDAHTILARAIDEALNIVQDIQTRPISRET